MYYEYPIEQLARSATTQFQMGFARMTLHLLPKLDDVAFEPSVQGLKIFGANEMALRKPGEIIRQIHSDDVELRAPKVRLIHDVVVREPVMWIRAAVPAHCAEAVLHDLIARGARIDEADWGHPVSVVRAQAPLRNLLGYPAALAALTHDGAELAMWLSHYEPVPPEPGNEAA